MSMDAKTKTEADANWTCRQCEARITDIQPTTWLAVPCGHYITHVQMVMMTYGPPSWPVTTSPAIDPDPAMPPRIGRRALTVLGWVSGSLVVLAFGAGLVLQWQDEQADRDFANWCSAQGGRTTFSTGPSGWTDTGSGRCFEYGTSRLIVTEDQWRSQRP